MKIEEVLKGGVLKGELEGVLRVFIEGSVRRGVRGGVAKYAYLLVRKDLLRWGSVLRGTTPLGLSMYIYRPVH